MYIEIESFQKWNSYGIHTESNATYIVSNDSHFDVLKQTDFPKLVVKRIQEFSKILEQEVI